MLVFGLTLLVLTVWVERWNSVVRLRGLSAFGDAAAAQPHGVRWVRGRPSKPANSTTSSGQEVAIIADLLEELLLSGTNLTGALMLLGSYEQWSPLAEVANSLEQGTAWHRAWRGVPAEWQVLAGALETSWRSGAAPSSQLRVLSRAQREREKKLRAAAAGRLGVWLLLPLGLCYLPAFVLVAVVPLLVGLADSFFT